MRLLIDIGNTSAKLAVADIDDRDIRFVHFMRKETSWAETFAALLSQYPIDSCALSSVAGEDAELDAALAELPFCCKRIQYDTPCAVKPLRGVPRGYGADRIAADFGALMQDSEHTLLIIDAGTCVTYDLFSAEGDYLGGCIAPGVALKLKAMHEHTALLPLVSVDGALPLMGHDTETALRCGAVRGTCYEIEGCIRRLMQSYPDLHVFVTGGNAFDFSDEISPRITQDPYLVMRGLCIV